LFLSYACHYRRKDGLFSRAPFSDPGTHENVSFFQFLQACDIQRIRRLFELCNAYTRETLRTWIGSLREQSQRQFRGGQRYSFRAVILVPGWPSNNSGSGSGSDGVRLIFSHLPFTRFPIILNFLATRNLSSFPSFQIEMASLRREWCPLTKIIAVFLNARRQGCFRVSASESIVTVFVTRSILS
jgi:hypothetical protein